jgi:hypothetical protein
MLRQEDLQVSIGRCAGGGNFVYILHLPTGISRQKGPLVGESYTVIKNRFLREIEQELVANGMPQYIVPAYRKGPHDI